MTWNKYLLVLWIATLWPLQACAAEVVWFLYDDANKYHQQYVSESESSLKKMLPNITVRREGFDADSIAVESGDRLLVVSVGAKAARQAAQLNYTTLNTLITRRTSRSLKELYSAPVSAVYLEQPANRQLTLIKRSLPSRKVITVLLGGEDKNYENELMHQSKLLGLQIRFIKIDAEKSIDDLFGHQLQSDDSLLLLPDTRIVNRRTVKPLVLGSYRQGIPLVGYSHALVKAGALMAVHSTLPALEKELVEMVTHFFSTEELPVPRYSSGYKVSVNYQLARALKLSLPSEDVLQKRMEGPLQ